MASKKLTQAEVIKENGQLVTKALQTLNEQPTLYNLARHIASKYDNNDVETVKTSVKNVLDKGIDLGIIVCKNDEYFLYGHDDKNNMPKYGHSSKQYSKK